MGLLRNHTEKNKRSAAKAAKHAQKRLAACFLDVVDFLGVPADIAEGALLEAMSRMVANIDEFTTAGGKRLAALEATMTATVANKKTPIGASATMFDASAPMFDAPASTPRSAETPFRPMTLPAALPSSGEMDRRQLVPGRPYRHPEPSNSG